MSMRQGFVLIAGGVDRVVVGPPVCMSRRGVPVLLLCFPGGQGSLREGIIQAARTTTSRTCVVRRAVRCQLRGANANADVHGRAHLLACCCQQQQHCSGAKTDSGHYSGVWKDLVGFWCHIVDFFVAASLTTNMGGYSCCHQLPVGELPRGAVQSAST